MNLDKVHKSELDENGNFKETLHPANILRWIVTLIGIALMIWMIGYW